MGHVPQVSLLLDLLHGAGFGVRYWGVSICGHVGLGLGVGLLGTTNCFDPTREILGVFWFGGLLWGAGDIG